MAMCKHSQEFETCSFGCTFRQAADLRLENERYKTALEKISEGHSDGNPVFLIQIAKQALQDTNKDGATAGGRDAPLKEANTK